MQCVLSQSSAGKSLLVLELAVSHGTARVLHRFSLACEVSCIGTVEIEVRLVKITNPVSVVFQTAAAPVPLNSETMSSKDFS